MRATPALFVAVLFLGACAHEPALKPAPVATRVIGDDFAATSETAGVRITVDSNAWRGDPGDLTSVVPTLVRIRNDSGGTLLLRYRAFSLRGPTGTQLAALPPLAIGGEGLGGSGEQLDPPIEPKFQSRGLLVPPPANLLYPTLGVWPEAFPYDAPSTISLWPEGLPTRDMVEKAIPEGVLVEGGEVEGFIFFRDIPAGIDRLMFRAELVDAQTGRQFGIVEIPFLVTED